MNKRKDESSHPDEPPAKKACFGSLSGLTFSGFKLGPLQRNFVSEPNFFLATPTARFGVERAVLINNSVVWASVLNEDTKSTELGLEAFRDDIIEEICKFMYTRFC